jgi:GNAT superfamily N-acetyltransferase
VKVRAATRDDAVEMARVHYESSRAAYGVEDDLERRLRNWHVVFDTPDQSPFVAEDDGEVVGVLNVGPDELHVIYVLPGWWGSGAGQLLIEKAHEVLAQTCDEAVLTVLAANPRARRFYERNGWRLDRVETELHFGGVPTEVAKYRKRLGT